MRGKGRFQPLQGKHKSKSKAPGKKPNPNRQREVAARKRKKLASALKGEAVQRRRVEKGRIDAPDAEVTPVTPPPAPAE